jgi:NAD(P)-dependent dehydrogenase (short-subunit alcohol dehydrogenase family)
VSERDGNKVILITGATDGIGRLTAMLLARQNAYVIVHGRSEQKIRDVIKELSEYTQNDRLEGISYDLSSLSEVRNMAEEVKNKFEKLDVLINNAGVGFADPRYSKDGYELRFAVNYLAPFLLTQLLLPLLKKSAPSRIVNVSSVGQHKLNFDDIMLEKNFDSFTAYRQSKLALILYTFELAERLKDENITVNALHPGTLLDTNMVRNAGIAPWGEPETGADAEVYLALSEELNNVTGKYFNIKKESKPDSQAYDYEARKKLWEMSIALTKLKKEKSNEYT